MVEAIEKEKSESKKRIKTLESGVAEEMSNNKKELIGKIETVEADIKKKVEMEANETRFVHFLAFTRFVKGQAISKANYDLPKCTQDSILSITPPITPRISGLKSQVLKPTLLS